LAKLSNCNHGENTSSEIKKTVSRFYNFENCQLLLSFEFNILLFSEAVRKKSSIGTLMENVSEVIGKPLVDLLEGCRRVLAKLSKICVRGIKRELIAL
jgi:hypothetical protein